MNKTIIRLLVLISALSLLSACAQSAKTPAPTGAPTVAPTAAPTAAKLNNPYTNPVFNADFPDPTIIHTSTGWYYGYATQSIVDGKWQNIQVIRSKDLVHWERVGDGLPVKPTWASKTQNFWAPDVSEHDGRYYMYFSAEKDNNNGGMCLGAAKASDPGGPFQPVKDPLICGSGFVNIDAQSFDDPQTGKRLLYWGSGFQAIKVRELAPDRVSFLPDSETKYLVFPDRFQPYSNLVEGTWVVYRDGYYYLFYSGDNCCGNEDDNFTPHYAVMVARSKSATGPFETLAKATGAKSSVILEMDRRWDGPGHNSMVRDAAGQDWIFYHAIDPNNRVLDVPSLKYHFARRVMLMDPIEYKDGWPVIPGAPSSKEQAGPVIAKP